MTKETNTGYYNIGDWNEGNYNTGDYNTGGKNTGDYNTGGKNTGDYNAGNYNTGGKNTGDYNTGDYNTGDYNAGYCNTGDYNAGNYNAGDWNAGNYNAGYCNTGNWNAGNYNAGDWNAGNYNAGYCNSITPKNILVFNKPLLKTEWDKAIKPEWMRVFLTSWVKENNMSDKEKEAYPSYVTTGGYLKFFSSLKSAYVDAWEKAPIEDKKLTLELPNYNIEVFKEVFGFTPSLGDDSEKETETNEITLNGIVYVPKDS